MTTAVIPDLEVWVEMGLERHLSSLPIEIRSGKMHTSTKDEVLALMADDAAILVTGLCPVDSEILMKPQLRLVVKAGIGTDNIDLQAAEKAGVTVVRTTAVNVNGLAEHSIGMMIAMSRRFQHFDDAVRSGDWWDTRRKYAGQCAELGSQTLGIIGFGGIGRRLAQLAAGMGMEVLVCDPPQARELQESEWRVVALDDLLSSSDFVSINSTLTPATHHLIDDRALRLMQPTSFLINAARGPIVDTLALAAALEENRIGGAAIDVFESEPPTGHPLLSAPNCLLSPHLAGSTRDGYERIGEKVFQHIAAWLEGRPIASEDVVTQPSKDFT